MPTKPDTKKTTKPGEKKPEEYHNISIAVHDYRS
jgi:hypothetical protein